MAHETCPTCGIDLHSMHPMANLMPHFTKECKPEEDNHAAESANESK